LPCYRRWPKGRTWWCQWVSLVGQSVR
jgi:hypothetical protein